MSLLEWKDEFTVKNDELDAQHKTLFELIYLLQSRQGNDANRYAVEMILMELVDYMDYHFTFEEQYMRDAGYPEINDHHEMHSSFVKKYSDYLENYKKGNETLSEEFVQNLKRGWIEHILSEDAKYVPYMKEKVLA